MSERLRQFVVEVSSDLDRAKRLTANPEAELEQTDLTLEEKQIVLTRDPDALREALGADSSEILAMNSFFKKPPARPRKPRKPTKPRVRKPAKKAPAKKRTTRRPAKRGTQKTTSRKGGTRRPGRKSGRSGRRGRR